MLYAVTVELRSRGVVRTMPRFYVEATSEYAARQMVDQIVFTSRFSPEAIGASYAVLPLDGRNLGTDADGPLVSPLTSAEES